MGIQLWTILGLDPIINNDRKFSMPRFSMFFRVGAVWQLGNRGPVYPLDLTAINVGLN